MIDKCDRRAIRKFEKRFYPHEFNHIIREVEDTLSLSVVRERIDELIHNRKMLKVLLFSALWYMVIGTNTILITSVVLSYVIYSIGPPFMFTAACSTITISGCLFQFMINRSLEKNRSSHMLFEMVASRLRRR